MSKKQSQSNIVIVTCVTSWLGDSSCYQGEGNYKGLHNVCYPGVRLTLGPGPAGGDHMWSGDRSQPELQHGVALNHLSRTGAGEGDSAS